MVHGGLIGWARVFMRRLKWNLNNTNMALQKNQFLKEAHYRMTVERYLPKLFMKAMDELNVTTLDESLGKKLHDRILERVFNAQSNVEVLEYQAMKRERMSQQDNSKMGFRQTRLAESECKESNKKRKIDDSKILFPSTTPAAPNKKNRTSKNN